MFVFVFEGVLFEFAYAKPAFALLFALPLNRTPRERPTLILFFYDVSLFKPITVAVSSQSDTAGKGVALLDFQTDIENVG